MEVSRFTKPEIEAALQLIQLSGESDVNVSGDGFSYFSGEILQTTMKIRRVNVFDNDESQGSNTSDLTSARRPKKKKKKFRSIVEIYEKSR